MFKKRYEHKFSREFSYLIDRMFMIPEKVHEIFMIGLKTPQDMWGTNSIRSTLHLKELDNLIQDVTLHFTTDLKEGCISFCMIVNVNASFMPDTTDALCQEYFNGVLTRIQSYFAGMTEADAVEAAHAIEEQYLGGRSEHNVFGV